MATVYPARVRRRHRSLFVGALVVIAAIGLCGCGRDLPPVVGTSSIAANERATLPSISGSTLSASPLDIADLHGKVVVLNAWASWCEPCRTEIPAFVDLARQTNPKDVAIVGLDVSDDPDAARAFEKDFSMPYPSIADPDGSLLRTIPGVPPSAIPSTVILDKSGRIAVRIIGPTDPSRLASIVAEVVSEG